MNHKPMLNAYPDSLGGNLGDIVTLLKTEAMQDVFSSFYILPSLYHSDLDRGFSVIDYVVKSIKTVSGLKNWIQIRAN